MENKDNKSIGYRLGQVLGSVITVCIMVAVIALTAKLLLVLF